MVAKLTAARAIAEPVAELIARIKKISIDGIDARLSCVNLSAKSFGLLVSTLNEKISMSLLVTFIWIDFQIKEQAKYSVILKFLPLYLHKSIQVHLLWLN